MDERDLKALLDEQRTLWQQFRAEHERLLAQHKDTQRESSERLERLGARLDEIETRLARPPVAAPTTETAPAATAVKAAFMAWCRRGLDGCTPEQRQLLLQAGGPAESKALSTAQGTEFLAPPEFATEILAGVAELSPIRSIAQVQTTTAKSKKIPKETGTFDARWIAKTGTRTETTGQTFGMEEVPTHELYALVDVPFEDLEDAGVNLESYLVGKFAERFGVAEGKAFILGDGAGEPEGLLTNTAIASVNSGSASAITADGLIDLYFSLKDAYARNARWVLRRSTIAAIRKLKDSQGNYLWQPGLAGALPATILDRPYVEAVDMPAVAANAYPVLFGDFGRGYLVLDRVQLSVQRDPYSQAASGAVRFHARRRVGGQVVVAEAIKKLRIST